MKLYSLRCGGRRARKTCQGSSIGRWYSRDHREKTTAPCAIEAFSPALSRITRSSCSPIRMTFWLILERTQDWTRSYHSVNNWSLFPKVLSVFVLNCVNVKEYCSVQVPTWCKNIGSVGLFRSFTHFLPMSWNFLAC